MQGEPFDWTPRRKARLAEQWLAGVLCEDIALSFGCTEAQVSYQRKMMGLPDRRPHGNRYTSPWTEEKVKRLEALWDDPTNSASDIAKVFGVSKNAVVSKAHRLGLPGRPSPIKPKGSGRGPGCNRWRARRKALLAGIAAAQAGRVGEGAPTARQSNGEVPRSVPALVAPELETSEGGGPGLQIPSGPAGAGSGCQYIHGDPKHDPDWHICGAERQSGSSYCPEHHRACHLTKKQANAVREEWARAGKGSPRADSSERLAKRRPAVVLQAAE